MITFTLLFIMKVSYHYNILQEMSPELSFLLCNSFIET